ncbi:MAG: S8 family serine peptidase [Rhodospirillaceae bacterium]|nr:S8 family serine peptidase [Rhodospirillaceae bacterium]
MSTTGVLDAFHEQLSALAAKPLPPVDVAILDSGIDATHPDLAGRVVEAYHFRPEGEGGAVTRTQVPAGTNNDTYGHGTGVASIVARIAPHARLYDLRVLEPGNKGVAACVIAGLKFALERRWRLINLSLAVAEKFSPQLIPLCEKAYFQNQILVASKRNFPFPDVGFPAAYASTIGIEIGRFESPFRLVFNPEDTIEFTALGENITIANVGGGYTTKSGTSFATPVVTALCALLIGAHPALRPFEVKALLKHFANQQAAA